MRARQAILLGKNFLAIWTAISMKIETTRSLYPKPVWNNQQDPQTVAITWLIYISKNRSMKQRTALVIFLITAPEIKFLLCDEHHFLYLNWIYIQ